MHSHFSILPRDASLERVVQVTVILALFVLGILIIREFSSLVTDQ